MPTSATDRNGVITDFAYIAEIDQLGQTDHTRDAMGNLLDSTDPRSALTQRLYNAFHRVTQVTDALNGISARTYDDADNLTSVTDQNGNTTTYTYNGFGEVTEEVSPDRGTIKYEYDEAGNLAKRTDAKNVKVTYDYDALNRLIKKDFPGKHNDEDVTYAYDDTAGGNHGVGRLTSVTDSSGTTSFFYNHLGQMTAETRLQDGVTQTVNYAYDLAGNLTQIVYPSGRIVDYSLDALGRPLSVTYKADAAATAQTVASNITYLPFGPVSSLTLGNGVDVTYTYDLDYRLTRIQAQAPGGGAMLQDLTLAFDGSGNITGIADAVDAARTQSLSYDLLNRLTQAIGPWGTDDYTYDKFKVPGRANALLASCGNRLSRTLNADVTSYIYATDSNRLLEVITATLTREMFYDAT